MDRFNDPLSPDYTGPTPNFSEAGFAEALEALEAPKDTPERRATFDGARRAALLVRDLWPSETMRSRT
ncbi:MAG TPA: hypothetical protein VFJ16_06295 [Longimicrobium sp.]|nr:hypothetical protein [Longimicrobium sp.]